MRSARDEVLLTVTATTEWQVKADSSDLLDWLGAEPELRGRVRTPEEVMEDGKMGGSGGFGDIVVEGLVQGTLATTVAAFLGYVGHSVGTWWGQRRGSSAARTSAPTVTATLSNGVTVVISGLSPAEAAAALTLAGATRPEPASDHETEDGVDSAPSSPENQEAGPTS
ncbi:effector-associated constant component EACC1 [Streptomyces sp. NPDC001809]